MLLQSPSQRKGRQYPHPINARDPYQGKTIEGALLTPRKQRPLLFPTNTLTEHYPYFVEIDTPVNPE